MGFGEGIGYGGKWREKFGESVLGRCGGENCFGGGEWWRFQDVEAHLRDSDTVTGVLFGYYFY